jgi:hypothetical protein
VTSFTPLPLYTRYPLDRRLGGPQRWSGRRGEKKIRDPTGTRISTPWLVQLRYPGSYIHAVFLDSSRQHIDTPEHVIKDAFTVFTSLVVDSGQLLRRNGQAKL